MSVDINWESLTGGADGATLAETIRDLVHERFQSIPLPKLIRSVKVNGFEFGQTAPEIVLKDICDPLPDFYEDDEDDEASDVSEAPQVPMVVKNIPVKNVEPSRPQAESERRAQTFNSNLTRGTTPGILGTTSNLGYFHLPLSGGLGTNTPLAAVAGAQFAGASSRMQGSHRHTDSYNSVSPPSSATPTSLQEHQPQDQRAGSVLVDHVDGPADSTTHERPDISPEDIQIVFHVKYAGDFKLSMTADVFLDYPMPSFVGIPLKLKITGLAFNGVGIVAYIKKKAHLCFLSPDDAEALVGSEATLPSLDDPETSSGQTQESSKVGGLLEHIQIESEMGETDSGKQVLKNVGKIEKFILEQVQRIFEDEFVYPSFWTFLV